MLDFEMVVDRYFAFSTDEVVQRRRDTVVSTVALEAEDVRTRHFGDQIRILAASAGESLLSPLRRVT